MTHYYAVLLASRPQVKSLTAASRSGSPCPNVSLLTAPGTYDVACGAVTSPAIARPLRKAHKGSEAICRQSLPSCVQGSWPSLYSVHS